MAAKKKKATASNITKDWFGNWSNEYDDTLGKIGFHTELLKTVARYSKVKKSDSVLDIGSGTGLLSLRLLKKTDCSITGIDSSKEMTAIFQKKIKKLKLEDNITCQIMDANELKFKKNTFDKVVSTVTLHHIKNKDKVIKKVYNTLKPGGIFVIGEIDMDTTGKHDNVTRLKRIIKVLEDEWFMAMKNVSVEAFERLYDNGKKHIFNQGEYCISLKQWAQACRKAGFKNVIIKKLSRYNSFGIVAAAKN